MQRIVEQLEMLALMEIAVGLHRLVERPLVVVAIEDAGLRHDLGARRTGVSSFTSSPIWLISL